MTRHICVDCNFCCDGTLFGWVQVTPSERDMLGGGPDFQDVEGRLAMRQGCARLGSDGACTRYSDRPAKCDAFDCKLLKRMNKGEVSEDFARHVVAEAKDLRARALRGFQRVLPSDLMPEDADNPRRCLHALEDAMSNGAAIPAHEAEMARWTYLVFAMMLSEQFHDTSAKAQVAAE